MDELKIKILNTFIPRAVLWPLTEKAKNALPYEEKMISIKKLPFKIGREARIAQTDKGSYVKLRISENEDINPSNDAYIVDKDQFLQVSKHHCEIVERDGKYILVDRGSTNGTILNNTKIGKDEESLETELQDGDIIQFGSEKSEFKYQFLTLEI